MSYKSGDLEVCTDTSTDEDGDMYHHAHFCPSGDMYHHAHFCPSYDARSDSEAKNPRPLVWLPHSCDSWVIGGLAEARALAADLAVAIKAMEGDS